MTILYIAAYICFSFLMAFVGMVFDRKYDYTGPKDNMLSGTVFFLFWPIIVPIAGPVYLTMCIFKRMQKLVNRIV